MLKMNGVRYGKRPKRSFLQVLDLRMFDAPIRDSNQFFYIALCLLVSSALLNIVSAKNPTPPNANVSQSVEPKPPRPNDSTKSTSEKPYFDDVSQKNVTAIVGQSTILKCRVKHLGNRTVSWMRKRDLHILTSSIITYTGDGRFSVRHPVDSDDWDLKIDYVQKRDADVYECQVNTEPKISLPIQLHVEDAQANIWGSQEVFVKKGSTISLTCSVNVHGMPPSSVLWFHGTSLVDFDSTRGGISLETEKTDLGTTSKLLVTKASLVDSGNYTCVPSNAHAASVIVHVLNGEHPAAMQTSSSGWSTHHYTSLAISLISLLILQLLIQR